MGRHLKAVCSRLFGWGKAAGGALAHMVLTSPFKSTLYLLTLCHISIHERSTWTDNHLHYSLTNVDKPLAPSSGFHQQKHLQFLQIRFDIQ